MSTRPPKNRQKISSETARAIRELVAALFAIAPVGNQPDRQAVGKHSKTEGRS